ncbi:hypothetical protein [Nocardia sp. NPDC051750]|uniref:hypothetical protein n=1 Tax=Nocardia sp. NPDC051750 TaxID=3364325 RepID=UPI00379D7432
MPSSSEIAAEQLEATVAQLREQHLADVVYYVLSEGDNGELPEEWDFGDWHVPTMGVELITDSGQHYSMIWDHTFTYYALETYPKPMTEILTAGRPWGSMAVPVSGHPEWVKLIGQEIVTADICWAKDPLGTVREPVAVHLGLRDSAVWIIAGRPADPGAASEFSLGTDDVLVVFTPEMAARAGIPDSAPLATKHRMAPRV